MEVDIRPVWPGGVWRDSLARVPGGHQSEGVQGSGSSREDWQSHWPSLQVKNRLSILCSPSRGQVLQHHLRHHLPAVRERDVRQEELLLHLRRPLAGPAGADWPGLAPGSSALLPRHHQLLRLPGAPDRPQGQVGIGPDAFKGRVKKYLLCNWIEWKKWPQ